MFLVTSSGINLREIVTNNHLFLLFISILIFVFIIGKNIITIFKVFLNKDETVNNLKDANTSLNQFIKVISSLNIIYLITTLLIIAFSFMEDNSIHFKILSFTSFSLTINFLIIILSKMFELRLNAELIGKNQ